MNYDELPASVRKLVNAQTGTPAARTSRHQVGGPVRLRCPRCGTVYRTSASADRSTCRRLDVMFD